jgi:hypothetical protein
VSQNPVVKLYAKANCNLDEIGRWVYTRQVLDQGGIESKDIVVPDDYSRLQSHPTVLKISKALSDNPASVGEPKDIQVVCKWINKHLFDPGGKQYSSTQQFSFGSEDYKITVQSLFSDKKVLCGVYINFSHYTASDGLKISSELLNSLGEKIVNFNNSGSSYIPILVKPNTSVVVPDNISANYSSVTVGNLDHYWDCAKIEIPEHSDEYRSSFKKVLATAFSRVGLCDNPSARKNNKLEVSYSDSQESIQIHPNSKKSIPKNGSNLGKMSDVIITNSTDSFSVKNIGTNPFVLAFEKHSE